MTQDAGIRISVLVATYNQGGYLGQCLDSLKAQTLRRWLYEIVVVNDASTDHTTHVLLNYKDRIKIFTHSQRQGLSASCNLALENALGHYVVRVDSDDWLDRRALENLLGTAESGADIIIPYYWIASDGETHLECPQMDNVFTWVAGGPLLSRALVARVGGYRNFFWEEYDLYLRMLMAGARIQTLPIPILFHREHPCSMTASAEARRKGWLQLLQEWPWEILTKYGNHEELFRFTSSPSRRQRPLRS